MDLLRHLRIVVGERLRDAMDVDEAKELLNIHGRVVLAEILNGLTALQLRPVERRLAKRAPRLARRHRVLRGEEAANRPPVGCEYYFELARERHGGFQKFPDRPFSRGVEFRPHEDLKRRDAAVALHDD